MDVVLNWLWQGSVVGLAAAAILRAIPRSCTGARYGLAWAACIAVVVLPAVPLLGSAFTSVAASGGTPGTPSVAMPAVWWTSGTAACAAWALWAAASAWRTAAAMFALRTAKREARDFPVDLEAQLLHWRRLRTTGRRARLVISDGVQTAGVLGGRTPVIAVAPTLLDQLDAADLERVLIHEWAHVQRRDDIAQGGVRVMRALAGWHPAVWWLERQLHIEREVACDEMAVAVTGCAKAYATCLTTLAAISPLPGRVPALAAVSSSGLRQRVNRIVARRGTTAARARFMLVAGAAAVAILTVRVGGVQIVGALATTGGARVTVADRVITDMQHPSAIARADEDGRPRVTRRAARDRSASSGPQLPPTYEAPEVYAVDSPALLLGATTPLTGEAFVIPDVVSGASSEPAIVATASQGDPKPPVWGAAMDAGKIVGAGSEQAAVATAGFFTRVGKQVARSF